MTVRPSLSCLGMSRSTLPGLAATLTFVAAAATGASTALALDVVARASSSAQAEPGVRQALRVRCDIGQRLGAALRQAQPGATVTFSGTCTETLRISTDGLRLRGLGGAVIDGAGQGGAAVVEVDGARRVLLEQFTVQRGDDQGVLWRNGAQGVMKRVQALSNHTVGLSIDGAQVDVEDLKLDHNAGGGMDAYSAARVIARGSISASHNGGDGLAMNAKSYLELRGAKITAQQNAGSGVSIINDSRLQVLSFAQAQGSRVTAEGNGFAGIGLLGSALGVVGSQYFGSGANVFTASANAIGIFMPAGAILSPHATAKFVVHNNGVGLLLEDGAQALIVGGLSVRGNATGLSASGAGTLTLVSTPPNPSEIQTNTSDVELGFGTRATMIDILPATLQCDASVLLRGSVACP